MQRICVFCGSSPGSKPEYAQAARDLGEVLAGHKIGLVYGGGKVGMMGLLARSVMGAGGEVIGIIPKDLEKVANREVTDLRVVGSMHERKALMAELSDAFIALPGGLGTIEEIFEILTWAQLGLHKKPVGFLNVAGYYDRLLAFMDYAVAEQFIQPVHRTIALVDDNPENLLRQFSEYQPPAVDKAAWALELSRGQ